MITKIIFFKKMLISNLLTAVVYNYVQQGMYVSLHG